MFSWSSGFHKFTGLVNWGFLLLTMSGFRLLLENLIKYVSSIFCLMCHKHKRKFFWNFVIINDFNPPATQCAVRGLIMNGYENISSSTFWNRFRYGIRVDPIQWFIVLSGRDEGAGFPSIILLICQWKLFNITFWTFQSRFILNSVNFGIYYSI